MAATVVKPLAYVPWSS